MSSNQTEKTRSVRKPTTFEAFSTIIMLLLAFGIGTWQKLNTVPIMIVVAGYVAFLGWRCGYTWKEMERAAGEKIGKSLPVIMIIVAIGFMVGALMYAGTLPMVIYYGLKVISPRWIALGGFLLCSLFSIATGTSFGSISTAGLTVMAVAFSMENVNVGLVAGACYAGAMFGDKLSPLSDSTILASMVTDNDLFDHVRHQAKTVVPAAVISVGIYIVLGVMSPAAGDTHSQATIDLMTSLDNMYKWNMILLIPLIFVLWGALTKKSTVLILFGAGFLGLFIGSLLYQGFHFKDGVEAFYSGFKAQMVASVRPDFNVETMSSAAKQLIERGGMLSMSKTFFTIFFCYYFGSIAEFCGVLDVFVEKLAKLIHGTFSLTLIAGIASTIITAVGGSGNIGLLMGGTIFKKQYEKMGVDTLNLSRTLDDFAVGSAGLFPWTGSGALYPSVLMVSSINFIRYSYLTWIVWILALVFAATGICMKPTRKNSQHS